MLLPEFKEQSPEWPSEKSEIKHLRFMPAAKNTIYLKKRENNEEYNTSLLR